MKIKTSELTGIALDWAVTFALYGEQAHYIYKHNAGFHRYSTSWERGGPIIEGEGIAVLPPTVRRISKERHAFPVPYWRALIQRDDNELAIHGAGPTPLIAAMRCFVASRLGDEVEVPDELA